jgi:hypothetical protein
MRCRSANRRYRVRRQGLPNGDRWVILVLQFNVIAARRGGG